MYIVAKQGTPFELCIKEACDKIKSAQEQAIALAEKSVGAKPISLAYIYHWGIIVKFVPEFTFTPEEELKIDKSILRPIPNEKGRWKPNLRTKAGKQFKAEFCKFAKDQQVTEEIFHPFGIHMVNQKKFCSYFIKPIHNSETNRYMLLCNDGIPNAFDKEKISQDQFDIEYKE